MRGRRRERNQWLKKQFLFTLKRLELCEEVMIIGEWPETYILR